MPTRPAVQWSLVLCLLCLASGRAAAQVIYAVPRDERVEKRYARYLTTYAGRQVVIGEPKLGITCSPTVINRTGGSEAKNEMWVLDQADPEFVPYKWEDGKRVKNGKRSVCVFSGDDFPTMKYVDRLQTLEGMAKEYAQRRHEIDMVRAQRDQHQQGDAAWFGAHTRMLARLDRLASWLVNMGYPAATKKLDRQIGKEKKAVARDAVILREKKASASIKSEPTPKLLAEKAKEIIGPKARFRVQASQHVRMVYTDQLPDGEAERGLALAEEIIEAFRKEFVDPYRSEEFADYIPDGRFAEFCFVPDNDTVFERFRAEYYGHGWGNDKNKERAVKMAGSSLRGSKERSYISYWRLKEIRDIEGIVAHRMGHMLANLHYCRGGRGQIQDWLEEAVGYYVSFGHLGRNSVTCFQWHEPTYARPAREEGKKEVAEGLRGHFNRLALEKGPKIDALAIKKLADLSDADFAKAWSFFDYIALTMGQDGQAWLRKTCFAATSSKQSGFISRWREWTEEIFPVPRGGDVFEAVDQKWRQFAQQQQRRD